VQAEERITDPGLVAFNKAAALYRLGRYREAELHYRRCLENAEEPRRARAFYDLGNCLMQQDDGNDSALLRSAIKCFQQCLAREDADADLIANARHNLELAKLLLLKARPSPIKKHEDEDPEKSSSSSPRADDKGDDHRPTGTNPNTANSDPAKMGKAEPVTATQAEKAVESQQAPPGRGQLPPVQDQDQLVPLSPEDAAAHLQRAATRIMLERREHHQRSAQTPGRKVMDW
jgi:tetratricopeptide (TPR) repeat protein